MMIGNKVCLRKPECDDHEFVMRLRNRNKRYFFSGDSISLESHMAWYQEVMRDPAQRFYVIETVPIPQLVGTISLYDIDWLHRRAEYGRFIVAEKHRRKGYGNEALSLLLTHAFDSLNLNKVYGDILTTNTAAIALDKRLGFRQEGIFRQYIYKHGEYLNVVQMAVLRDEFRSVL